MTSTVGSHTWLTAAAYLAAGLIGAVALRAILARLQRRAQKTAWRGDDIVLAFLRSVAPWCAVAGCTWGAVLALPLKTAYRHDLNHALLAIIIIVTALGVGGLAVALALQDTLTNLFAGVHILTSRKVQPGDFIQLDNGMQGYVVDTNWRNTTIRQLPNNIIVVPNATVASSIVTNYHLPQQEMSVTVQVGVGYGSDLGHVERVTCEVGREVMREVEGAVPAHEP